MIKLTSDWVTPILAFNRANAENLTSSSSLPNENRAFEEERDIRNELADWNDEGSEVSSSTEVQSDAMLAILTFPAVSRIIDMVRFSNFKLSDDKSSISNIFPEFWFSKQMIPFSKTCISEDPSEWMTFPTIAVYWCCILCNLQIVCSESTVVNRWWFFLYPRLNYMNKFKLIALI